MKWTKLVYGIFSHLFLLHYLHQIFAINPQCLIEYECNNDVGTTTNCGRNYAIQTIDNNISGNCANIDIESSIDQQIHLNSEKLKFQNESLYVYFDVLNWNELEITIDSIQNHSQSVCGHIRNSKKYSSSAFHLKCSFSNEISRLQSYFLQLTLAVENNTSIEMQTKKFLLQIPLRSVPVVYDESQIQDKLFVYLDISNGIQNCFQLYVENVLELSTIDSFHVELLRTRDNATKVVNVDQIPAILRSKSGYFYATHEYCVYYFGEGDYHFQINALGQFCNGKSGLTCPHVKTSEFYIGRNRPNLLIGIVGVSFIVPFVLLLYRVLTKKYKDGYFSEPTERILILYECPSYSNRSMDSIIAQFVQLLREILEDFEITVDVIRNLKICDDLLMSASRIVYINTNDSVDSSNLTDIKRTLSTSEHDVLELTFVTLSTGPIDVAEGEQAQRKYFKMMDEFGRFLREIQPDKCHDFDNHPLYIQLKSSVKAAELQMDNVPKIVIEESGLPEENEDEKLLSVQ